jgi:hypothetical protein
VTPLDAKLVKVTSFNGRVGSIAAQAGDYAASQINAGFPSQRWDGNLSSNPTRTNTLDCIKHLLNGHPTDGLTTGRGVLDDFSSPLYNTSSSAISLASAGGGPGNTAASVLSNGLVRWQPDTNGALLYRDAVSGAFGAWAINSGASTSGGGLLAFSSAFATWAASSRYSVRITCRLVAPTPFSPVFVGLSHAGGMGSSGGVFANEILGFHFPATTATLDGVSYHNVTFVTPTMNLPFYAPTTSRAFEVALTYNPTKGCHLYMLSGGIAVELADTNNSGLPLAFAIAANGAAAINTDIIWIDYVGYSLVDLG